MVQHFTEILQNANSFPRSVSFRVWQSNIDTSSFIIWQIDRSRWIGLQCVGKICEVGDSIKRRHFYQHRQLPNTTVSRDAEDTSYNAQDIRSVYEIFKIMNMYYESKYLGCLIWYLSNRSISTIKNSMVPLSRQAKGFKTIFAGIFC